MRSQGRIVKWNDEKGFGFVVPDGGGQQAFIHVKSFANRQRRPVLNELVSYELAFDQMGRPQAERVTFPGERAPPSRTASRGNAPVLLATSFLAFVGAMALIGQLPVQVLWMYLAASVVVFAMYAHDKSAAQAGRWRIKESTLHVFALLGGWPGALAAQCLLRHKSTKASFQRTFWVTVALNAAVLGWLLWTSAGARLGSGF